MTNNQRRICISYESLDELFAREEHIIETMQNHLYRNYNNQYLADTEILIGENTCSLVLILNYK